MEEVDDLLGMARYVSRAKAPGPKGRLQELDVNALSAASNAAAGPRSRSDRRSTTLQAASLNRPETDHYRVPGGRGNNQAP